ncbi:hydroxydechloroatrazine ethylaminohydrolase [Ralstonia solanacearum]|nr:hydroxydechloroatrazine ethylaminohydrolase [Ralstonia solanacearum]
MPPGWRRRARRGAPGDAAGADHDPVAALVFCAPSNVSHSVINGRVVDDDGRLATLELDAHLTIHRRLALELAQAARAVPACA